jgi:PKD repeat protein
VTSANRTSTALVANFSAESVTGTAPLNVNFTDLSTGKPTSWAWDFENDGVIDNTTQNPQYTYRNSGNYSVLLTVKNATATESVTRTGYIQVKNATVAANITALPEEVVPTSTFSYLKAPPEDTISQDPTASGISADATSGQEKSVDLIGGIISVLQKLINHIAGGLNTLIRQLPFSGSGGPGT